LVGIVGRVVESLRIEDQSVREDQLVSKEKIEKERVEEAMNIYYIDVVVTRITTCNAKCG
jgi:hypothetical protein